MRLSVADQQFVMPLQALGEFFDDIDGTVLPAGTADGDGNVAAAFFLQAREPVVHKVVDVVHHFLRQGLLVEIRLNGGIHAGVGAQLGIVIGIGQATHIEHEIGVVRHAVFEAERLEDNQKPPALDVEPLLNGITQLLRVHFGCIDAVGDVFKREQPFALFLQAFQ